MMEPTLIRRSGRSRRATQYSTTFTDLNDMTDDDQNLNDDRSADDFNDDNASQDDDYVWEDAIPGDDVFMGEEPQDASEQGSVADFDAQEEIDSPRSFRDATRRKALRIRQLAEGNTGPNSLYNRVTHDDFHSVSKKERYSSLFGPVSKDMIKALGGRDRWANNLIFPKRCVDEKGRGGFCESFFRSKEATKAEATGDWEWYFENGARQRFKQHQQTRHLEEKDGMLYLPAMSNPSLKFLMGPRTGQRLVTLQTREWVGIEEVWTQAENEHARQAQEREVPRGRREGWMFNAGCNVQDMNWVPVRGGRMQYLALAAVPGEKDLNISDTQPAIPQDVEGPAKAATFTPSPPSPACIQFWAFSPSRNTEEEGRMDYSSAPKLSLVLCTNWGPVTQIRWCPAPRIGRDQEDDAAETILLAGVWGDGRVRVLDLPLPGEEETPTRYVKIESAAFESCPPDTICTCVDWLSASHIAVGCASGFVAIWDIAEHLSDYPSDASRSPLSPSHPTNPRPFFYEPLHQTYIAAIKGCYPSHPEFLLTTAMDGYVRLTDIHSPTVDYVLGPRSRTGNATLGWSDPIQCALTAEDNCVIRALALRRFYSSFNLARHTANILTLGVSSTHTTLLAGAADGSVLAINPMRKVIFPRSEAGQLTWFLHEWRRDPGGRNGGGDGGSDGNGGISRFTEGFRVESPVLYKLRGSRFADSLYMATIHELKSAVSHLAWNPNPRCGGWAAAAMADGLVRVEDLAVD